MGNRPSIYVFAGTNGPGVAGAVFRSRGGEYFSPDEAARYILRVNPGIGLDVANSWAWLQGKRLLERAVTEHLDFAFETTLGGSTIPRLLEDAHDAGLAVRICYVGLEDSELQLARVRARVAAGGHDVPESRIRERYDRRRDNLIRLLPKLTELRIFDNGAEGDPFRGVEPRPRLILHLLDGVIESACDLVTVPHWARPLLISALRLRSADPRSR